MNRNWTPTTVCVETTDGVVVRMELPGVKGSDLFVEHFESLLRIRGQKVMSTCHKTAPIKQGETRAFSKSIQLPHGSTSGPAQATFQDGVLHIVVNGPELKLTTSLS